MVKQEKKCCNAARIESPIKSFFYNAAYRKCQIKEVIEQ